MMLMPRYDAATRAKIIAGYMLMPLYFRHAASDMLRRYAFTPSCQGLFYMLLFHALCDMLPPELFFRALLPRYVAARCATCREKASEQTVMAF